MLAPAASLPSWESIVSWSEAITKKTDAPERMPSHPDWADWLSRLIRVRTAVTAGPSPDAEAATHSWISQRYSEPWPPELDLPHPTRRQIWRRIGSVAFDAGAEAQPLTGYDYMLLRVEGRTERDDWRLKDISDPLGKAVEALLKGDDKEAEAFRVTAITAAWQSDDLAVGDRRRVVQAIKAELDAVAKEGRQAVGDEVRSLADIVKVHAISAELANRLMPITLEEALSDGH
jgi:hypothetical protein